MEEDAPFLSRLDSDGRAVAVAAHYSIPCPIIRVSCRTSPPIRERIWSDPVAWARRPINIFIISFLSLIYEGCQNVSFVGSLYPGFPYGTRPVSRHYELSKIVIDDISSPPQALCRDESYKARGTTCSPLPRGKRPQQYGMKSTCYIRANGCIRRSLRLKKRSVPSRYVHYRLSPSFPTSRTFHGDAAIPRVFQYLLSLS